MREIKSYILYCRYIENCNDVSDLLQIIDICGTKKRHQRIRNKALRRLDELQRRN